MSTSFSGFLSVAAISALAGAAIAWVVLRNRKHATGDPAGDSDSRFEGILAIAADAIITIDRNQQILHFNWGAEQIFGYRAAEVIGQPLALLLPERFRATHGSYVTDFANAPETARRMGHRREIFGHRKNGEDFPAEASISKLRTGADVLLTVVLRDVTERKRNEEQQRYLASASSLLASSLEMEATLQSVVEVARPLLADCALLDVASAGRERHWVASGHDDDDQERALAGIAQDATTWRDVFPLPPNRGPSSPQMAFDRSGMTRPLSAREQALVDLLAAHNVLVVPLSVADRSLGRLLLFTTGDRQMGAQAVVLAGELASRCASALESARLYEYAQRATQARDEVLGVVSHDLRNPISSIAMLARALGESPPEDAAERARMLASITQATDWTNRLIQDLLDVTSIEAGRLSMQRSHERVEVLVGAAVEMVNAEAASRQHVLTVAIAPGLPSLHADAGRVVQVLTNLLGNAVKFTSAGGRIEVSAAIRNGVVCFTVSDTGSGIPEEERHRVFERFWQSPRGSSGRGSGLGLAIARGIVEAHGGTIWVEARAGGGSAFSFTVPAMQRTPSVSGEGSQ